MTAYWLIVLHLLGDYLLQSDWMAQRKTTSSVPAAAHAVVYTAPFWLLMPSWWAMLLIGGTHFVIDRWRLARYVCWFKNLISPPTAYADGSPVWWHSWAECQGTGYHKDRPAWLAVWLLIIADNTLHLAFNGLAWVLYDAGRL